MITRRMFGVGGGKGVCGSGQLCVAPVAAWQLMKVGGRRERRDGWRMTACVRAVEQATANSGGVGGGTVVCPSAVEGVAATAGEGSAPELQASCWSPVHRPGGRLLSSRALY